jgi:RNA ligase (TIGR02306 family)
MSTFRVDVLKLEGFGKHPNADQLSITSIYGSPVIFRSDNFKLGDKVAYIPIDAVVPTTDERFAWLNEGSKHPKAKFRVRAKKLRGIYSEGFLVPAEPHWIEGQDVAAVLGVEKWEEPEAPVSFRGDNAADPGGAPVYDIEGYRKYKSVLIHNEDVVVTEKLHGCNARFVYKDGCFHAGSHKQFKAHGDNLWWKVVEKYKLNEKLSGVREGFVLYGEIYGQVQDLRYDTKPGEVLFAAFDVYNSNLGLWMGYAFFEAFCKELEIPTVPLLYHGPYDPSTVEAFRSGKSAIASHMREGIVIKPTTNRWDYSLGRVIVKLVSEEYNLRKTGTEHH